MQPYLLSNKLSYFKIATRLQRPLLHPAHWFINFFFAYTRIKFLQCPHTLNNLVNLP